METFLLIVVTAVIVGYIIQIWPAIHDQVHSFFVGLVVLRSNRGFLLPLVLRLQLMIQAGDTVGDGVTGPCIRSS